MVRSSPIAQTTPTTSPRQTVKMDTSILALNQAAMNQLSPKPNAPLRRGSVSESSSECPPRRGSVSELSNECPPPSECPPHSPENRALREQALQYDQSSMRKYLSNTDMR